MITNNPEGKSFSDTAPYYFNTGGGPFEIMSSTIEANTPDQVDAMEKWNQTTEEKYALPPVTPTVDESMSSSRCRRTSAPIPPKIVYKFIMGVEPTESHDTYLQTLETLQACKRCLKLTRPHTGGIWRDDSKQKRQCGVDETKQIQYCKEGLSLQLVALSARASGTCFLHHLLL